MKSLSKREWCVLLSGVVIGGFLGGFLRSHEVSNLVEFVEHRDRSSEYQFINPLLSCGDDAFSRLSNGSVSELENETKALITGMKNTGQLTDAAVYFRELNGGPWFGLNQDALFTPGSLLKVPLILSIYKKAEDSPKFLTTKILYDKEQTNIAEHFKSPTIVVGKEYTIEDLARAAIINSDNNATFLLAKSISETQLDAAYADLGIRVPKLDEDYTMSVRTYASYFRMLFNATYLNHNDSEDLLKTLSETTFRDGLAAGVPSGVVVAHKFGEREYNGGNILQLHDCGIVYKKNSPFLLCVMMRTDSGSYETMANNIRDITKLVYQYAE